ncbi:GntR family transcriptional regulator [Xanthobacteraceae bacterium A53D]
MDHQDLHITRQAATLRLIVEDKMRSAIASGLFKPGQRLVERELCELIGVGRTSVREALRQLEAEGLVQTIPHRGPIVSTISPDEARQLYEIRALLEGYAGRQFAEHGSPEAVARLKAAAADLNEAAKSRDRSRLIGAKTHFYKVLMEGAGNVFAAQFLTSLHNRITLLRFTSMTQEGRLTQSMREIRAIVDAIAAGDGPAAEASCRRHIEEAAKVALGVLGGSAPEQQDTEASPPPVRKSAKARPAASPPARGTRKAASKG